MGSSISCQNNIPAYPVHGFRKLTCPNVSDFAIEAFLAMGTPKSFDVENPYALIPVQIISQASLKKESFVDEVQKFLNGELDDQQFLNLMRTNKDKQLSSHIKYEVLRSPLSTASLRYLLTKYKPALYSYDLVSMTNLQSKEALIGSLDLMGSLYQPTSKHVELDVLNSMYLKLGESMNPFWEIHKSRVLQPEYFNTVDLSVCHPDFLNFLLSHEGPASLFLDPIFTRDKPVIQKILRSGHRELVQTILKDKPIDQIPGDWAFHEELKDCLRTEPAVHLTKFDFKPVAVGRHGCRAVVFAENGDVHSFPGQNAAKLAEQIGETKDLDSFTIYFNPGHGSIAFSDKHFGFYPDYDYEVEELTRLGQGNISISTAQDPLKVGHRIGSFVSGVTSNADHSSTALKKIHKMILKMPTPLQSKTRCAVKDDAIEALNSEQLNGLTLTVYAPKHKIVEIHKAVEDTKASCSAGQKSYELFTQNCLDFIQQAIKASGIQADYRDAFHAKDYLGNTGLGTLFAMLFKSKQPIVHASSEETRKASYADLADSIPRQAWAATLVGIPSVLSAYFLYRGVSKMRDAAYLSAQRFRIASVAAMSIGAAVLTLPMRAFRRLRLFNV